MVVTRAQRCPMLLILMADDDGIYAWEDLTGSYRVVIFDWRADILDCTAVSCACNLLDRLTAQFEWVR